MTGCYRRKLNPVATLKAMKTNAVYIFFPKRLMKSQQQYIGATSMLC